MIWNKARFTRLRLNVRNPLRADPTKTTTIRARYAAETQRRFRKVKAAINDWLVVKDALGEKARPGIRFNVEPRQFEFRSDPGKLEVFNGWFRQLVSDEVLSYTGGTKSAPWNTPYIESAYKRGLVNAYIESRKADLLRGAAVGEENAEAFLRSSFNTSEARSKVELLALRAFEDLNGVTATMGAEMNRILAQGLAEGRGIDRIAREMGAKVESLGKSRATLIARTEVIRAHAEGQLDSFDRLGVKELGVQAEWSTAGDERVCPRCQDQEAKVFSMKEARGLIPLHPNCRCAWIPFLEDQKAQGRKQKGPAEEAKPQQAEGEPKFKTAKEYREAVLQAASGEAEIASLKTEVSAKVEESKRISTEWSKAIKAGEKEKANVLWEERRKITKELDADNAKISKARKAADANARAILVEGQNLTGMDFFGRGKALDKRREPIETVLSWMPKGKYSDMDVSRLRELYVEERKSGANLGAYSERERTIYYTPGARPSVVAHEFGHHISYRVSRVMSAQTRYFRERTEGEKVAALPGFRDSVVGKKDKWKKDYVYAGRVYRDGRAPEVIAVGVEHLYKNPVKFAKDDPDYFDAVVSWLKGIER